jgi:6-pyruvoyltetrahydropterin/6-carboxytetrahydropterin synthase
MYEVLVKSDFSSAHRLREYKGKCENLHGHNWKVEAAVVSRTLDPNGILLDFRLFKESLEKVMGELDHTNLNDLTAFKAANPTSENIAKFIFDKLADKGIIPQRVTVWESDTSCATYYGEE